MRYNASHSICVPSFFCQLMYRGKNADVCFGIHPSHLTISCLHHRSLVEPRLDAKLEDNREDVEVGEIETAGVDHGLGWVQHLLGQCGCLYLMMVIYS